LARLVECIINFPKLLIGVVNGPAVGFGVTILPLLDLVICLDTVEQFLKSFHYLTFTSRILAQYSSDNHLISDQY
jgi:hypothetical protein